jgi:hypothetical protein
MCGGLAGERYEGNGLKVNPNGKGMLSEDGFRVCVDCCYYAEYGKLDDMFMLDIDMQESDSFLELLMQGVKVTEVNPYILDFALENAGEKFTLRIEDICANNADNQAQVCYNLYDKHGKVIFNVFLHHLCYSHLEIFMSNMNASLSEGKHSCFGTYCFCFCS